MPPTKEQKAAELALKRKSRQLTHWGAHSFSVGFLRRGGKKRVGIIANFPGNVPTELPESFEVTLGGRKVSVPVKGWPRVPAFTPDVLRPNG